MELILKYFPSLSPTQIAQFTALYNLYVEWNAKINVISRKDIDNLYEHKGSNIFISDFLIGPDLNKAYGNRFLQGRRLNLMNVEVRGGYLINPKINLSAEAFLHFRQQKTDFYKQNNLFFGISLRTNMFNRYTDF